MGFRTLGVFLTTLCLMTSALVSANDMATNSSAISAVAAETVAQLAGRGAGRRGGRPCARQHVRHLEYQPDERGGAHDPAAGHSGRQPQRQRQLQLQQLEFSSSSSSTTSASAEATQSASAAGSTVSGATTVTLSAHLGYWRWWLLSEPHCSNMTGNYGPGGESRAGRLRKSCRQALRPATRSDWYFIHRHTTHKTGHRNQVRKAQKSTSAFVPLIRS
ncbi:hypothetical protein GQ600_26929 [Phytophthora cactorum]|nr:hypothetical protein GQ600_26929 [Phytophthora cactorum]